MSIAQCTSSVLGCLSYENEKLAWSRVQSWAPRRLGSLWVSGAGLEMTVGNAGPTSPLHPVFARACAPELAPSTCNVFSLES